MEISTQTDRGENDHLSIVVIDNRQVFAKGLSAVLRENWGEDIMVVEHTLADENYGELPEFTPEIVLMSCHRLPYHTLMDKVPEIAGRYGSKRIILYDFPKINLDVVPKLAKWNVYGYLAPDFDIPDFRRCIDVVLSGGKYISSDLVWATLFSGPAKKERGAPRLSHMEVIVARYLIQGIPVSVIAREMNRRVSTISTFKSKIFKKLNVDNIIELSQVFGGADEF